MKFKQIAMVLLLSIVVIIIFLPVDKTPDYDGYWTLQKVVINGKSKPVRGTANFFADNLHITNHHLDLNGFVEAKIKVNKDSIQITSDKNTFYNGTFKMSILKTGRFR